MNIQRKKFWKSVFTQRKWIHPLFMWDLFSVLEKKSSPISRTLKKEQQKKFSFCCSFYLSHFFEKKKNLEWTINNWLLTREISRGKGIRTLNHWFWRPLFYHWNYSPSFLFRAKKTNLNSFFKKSQPTIGLEPITVGLQNRCSTNWAKQANILITLFP